MEPTQRSFIHPKKGENQPIRYFFGMLLILFSLYFLSALPVSLAISLRVSPEDLNNGMVKDFASLFSNNEYFVLLMIPFVVGVLMVFFTAKVMLKRSLLTLITSRATIDWKRFLNGFIVWAILLISTSGLFLMGGSNELVWNYNPGAFWQLVLLSVVLTPIQTLFEELFFRGFLIQYIGTLARKGIVIIAVNGLAFGAMHLMNSEVSELGNFALVYYSLSGMYAAFLTVMDEGIELAWGFHTANNLIGIVLVTSTWQSFQTDALFIDNAPASVGFEMLITLFLLFPLMLLILGKLYKWKDWKSRLF